MNIFSNYSFLVAAMMGFVTLMYFRSQKTITRTSILDLYSKDLTKLARSGKIDPVIGRSAEISRVIQILCRRTKNNPVLVGDSGVGKTAIVEELANEIAQGRVPSMIKNKRLLQLDLSGLVAGTKYRGEFEKRLTAIVNEIIASQRSIILFIDEIHTLAEAGEASGAIDASDILKPALARGQLQAIGATTKEEYKMITQEKTLERRFQPVQVPETTPAETLSILKGLKKHYEKFHKIKINNK
jgi:ATP-dependent Clp protease ATP-binding subunit ClpC